MCILQYKISLMSMHPYINTFETTIYQKAISSQVMIIETFQSIHSMEIIIFNIFIL